MNCHATAVCRTQARASSNLLQIGAKTVVVCFGDTEAFRHQRNLHGTFMHVIDLVVGVFAPFLTSVLELVTVLV